MGREMPPWRAPFLETGLQGVARAARFSDRTTVLLIEFTAALGTVDEISDVLTITSAGDPIAISSFDPANAARTIWQIVAEGPVNVDATLAFIFDDTWHWSDEPPSPINSGTAALPYTTPAEEGPTVAHVLQPNTSTNAWVWFNRAVAVWTETERLEVTDPESGQDSVSAVVTSLIAITWTLPAVAGLDWQWLNNDQPIFSGGSTLADLPGGTLEDYTGDF